MQQERHVAGVRILIEMIDARGVERGRPPLDAVHGVAEAKQIFGEIGAVLPGNAGDQRNAPLRILNRHIFSNKAGLAGSRDRPAIRPAKPGTQGRSAAAQAIAFDRREV